MTLIVDPGVEGTGGTYVPTGFWEGFARAGYCGRSFNLGLIRFHDSDSGPQYRQQVLDAFPELDAAKTDVLAFDWNGRQVVTQGQDDDGEYSLLLADIGAGLVSEFLTADELAGMLKVDHGAIAFDEALYLAWKQSLGVADQGIEFTDCVELISPEYLGGQRTIDNLQLTDLDVSWTMGVQIWNKVKNLEPGTPVSFE